MATPVTPAVSRQAAANFWNTYRPADVKAVDAGQMQQVTVADLPMLHIWAVDDQGFIIMSASDLASPVLAYSFNSQATRNPNPEVRFWLNQYNTEIAEAEAAGLENIEAAAAWQSLLTSPVPATPVSIINVPELMHTRWDQGEPYNKYCPYDSNYQARTVVGCVATAMAQIMKYWNHPSSGVGYHSYSYGGWDNIEANFGQTTYMWDIMENRLDNFSSQRAIKPVATISYHCGVAVDMMYGPSATGGSGAYSTCGWWTNACAESAFRDFFKYNPDLYSVQRNTVVWRDSLAIDTNGNYYNVHYRVDSSYIPDSVWCRMIDSNLALGAPLYYSGHDTSGGHAFVLDGADLEGRYHFNWGWNGSYNGFYGINDVAPRHGGIGSNATHSFNSEQQAIFRILPVPEHFDSVTIYDTICRDMTTYTFHEYNFNANTDDTVYTAVWLDTVFTINLTRIAVRRLYVNPNGGTGSNYEIKFCPNDGVTIPVCRYTRENHIFVGWAFNPYQYDTLYQAGDHLHLYTSQTIYAIWRDTTVSEPPVSIDIEDGDEPSIAPNPAVDRIHFSLDNDEDVTINIIDSYGRVVIQKKAIGRKAEIMLDKLPSGSYTVQIITSDSEYKRRIIKL